MLYVGSWEDIKALRFLEFTIILSPLDKYSTFIFGRYVKFLQQYFFVAFWSTYYLILQQDNIVTKENEFV